MSAAQLRRDRAASPHRSRSPHRAADITDDGIVCVGSMWEPLSRGGGSPNGRDRAAGRHEDLWIDTVRDQAPRAFADDGDRIGRFHQVPSIWPARKEAALRPAPLPTAGPPAQDFIDHRMSCRRAVAGRPATGVGVLHSNQPAPAPRPGGQAPISRHSRIGARAERRRGNGKRSVRRRSRRPARVRCRTPVTLQPPPPRPAPSSARGQCNSACVGRL